MAITQAQLKIKLQTVVRDTTDRYWTSGEKDEAIVDALYDPVFSSIIEDATTTVVSGQYDYTVPSTIDVVSDIYLNVSGVKTRITREDWEQIGDTIRFIIPPSEGTLLIVGLKQVTDSIPEEKVNLALYLSCVKLYEMLLHKYSTGLLMADITGAEIMNSIDMFERRAQRERSRIHRVTNSRGYKI